VKDCERLFNFCQAHGIRYEQCGKLIVATIPAEETGLDDLFDRAVANGLKLER
jgi:L-2-hydroxyglutarate oxidase